MDMSLPQQMALSRIIDAYDADVEGDEIVPVNDMDIDSLRPLTLRRGPRSVSHKNVFTKE